MAKPSISVDHLWKRYHKQFGTSTLWSFFGRRERTDDEFWALKDVSFEVQPGECLGIIGPNGSGKSTLLKMLSRITNPTKGSIEVNGRVASMLEVGTGFHPELTGRENVYLSGAIMGMKRAEIRKRFGEIVGYSGVEEFIDVPVKRYSSGMYVRLAFAVAAHIQTDVLVVDEVLAVGDAEFQKKCLGTMNEAARGGRTVLFVSHNMGAISSLCSKAILLNRGEKQSEGTAAEVIKTYVSHGQSAGGERVWQDAGSAPGNQRARLRAVRILSEGRVTANVDIEKDVTIDLEYWTLEDGEQYSTSIHLLDATGGYVLASGNLPSANLIRDEWYEKPRAPGLYRARCTVPGNFLNEGVYGVSAFVVTRLSRLDVEERNVLSFTVHDTGAMRKEYAGQWIGVVRPKLAWRTEMLKEGSPLETRI